MHGIQSNLCRPENIENPMEEIIRGYISKDDVPSSENANDVVSRFKEIKSRVRYHG